MQKITLFFVAVLLPCCLCVGPMAMHVAPRAASLRQSGGVATAPRGIQRRNMCAVAIPGNSLGEEVIVGGLGNFFQIFNNLLLGRVLLSWFPAAQTVGFLQPLFSVCDPYLNLFRNLIPPIGGIDLSPLLAFTFLQVAGGSMAALGAETSSASSARLGQRKPLRWGFEAAIDKHMKKY